MLSNSISRSLLLAAFLAAVGTSQAATITYTSVMKGSNETPPNLSTASGSGTFVFDTVAQSIAYTISFSGLSASANAAHIHLGAVGVAGPIILPFGSFPSATAGMTNGTLTAANLTNQGTSGVNTFADILAAAQAGNLYSNIHDANYPAGEIRGQLVAAAAATPEPSTLFLLGGSLMAFPLLRKRSANRHAK